MSLAKKCLTITAAVMMVSVGTVPVQAASQHSDQDTLRGERRVTGTVEDVKGDQARVNTGEVQPRFIPLKPSREKGLPEIHKGDTIEITLNEQNLIVDYHLVDESGHSQAGNDHQVVKGQIAKPLAIGHDQAVIKTKDGEEKTFEIRSQARSKVASIPIGIDAVFLVDETNKIVDANFKDEAAAKQAGEVPHKKSPLKGTEERK